QCIAVTRAWSGIVSDLPDMRVRLAGAKEPDAGVDAADWASADESTLVDACLGGRRDAFDVIVERHRRQVYQLCYRFLGTHEDARDLAQDGFGGAYRGLNGFKGAAA